VIENSETALVEAAVGGDIDSFGTLCQQYYAALVAIGYSIIGEHNLAEDATQESFARALVKLKDLKNKSKFAPWIAAICRNVAKDMVTSKAKQIHADGLSEVAAGENCNDESKRVVRRAIDKLDEPDKELIVLRYYNSLSYEEIASVLGISGMAVNGRLTRAKKKLAKYLKQSQLSED
jgi:RNA polymerase sigma-70 factor (ECF subfamily)